MLQDLIREEMVGRTKTVRLVRADVTRDAHLEVKQRYYSSDIVLPDHTKKFLRTIKDPVPTTGQVIFHNIPIFATPGQGKTVLAIRICLELIEYYGRDKVAVYLSPHIPSLVDALRTKDTPVVIMIVDDALKYLISWGGTNQELKDTVQLFSTLRHEYEEANNTLNGIVFAISTSQMYMGIAKPFRDGIPIFKGAMPSDKAEIMKGTAMGPKAWEFLMQITRDVKTNKIKTKMDEAVVILDGFDAGRVRLTPKVTPLLKELVGDLETPMAQAALKQDHFAPMYKALEASWRIERTRLTPEQDMARLNEAMKVYARQFVDEGRKKDDLLLWLAERAFNLTVPKEKRIPSEDYLKLKMAATLKEFRARIDEAEEKKIVSEMEGEGFAAGEEMGDDAFLDAVSNRLLVEGFHPFDKYDKSSFISRLYRLPESRRRKAMKMKDAIASRVKELWIERNGVPDRDGGGGGGGGGDVSVPVDEISQRVDLGDAEFDVDPVALLDVLIGKARAANKRKKYRELVVFKATKFLDKYAGRTLGDPTVLATTPEGKEWQKEMFGHAYARSEMSKNKTAGAGIYNNHVGLLYESWVASKLREGYTIRGVFDKAPIKGIVHGGGNEHGPDLIVEYQDGTRDFVSLKCYHEEGSISITSNPRDTDEIHPERHAWLEAQRRGEQGNRIVVLVRNLYYEGFQAARVWSDAVDIPETLGFNKQRHIGYSPWVAPDREERDE